MPAWAAASVLPLAAGAAGRPGASRVVFAMSSSLLCRWGPARLLTVGGSVLRLRDYEVAQACVLLGAGRAAGQVRAHAGNGRVGIAAGQLDLDVAVELV